MPVKELARRVPFLGRLVGRNPLEQAKELTAAAQSFISAPKFEEKNVIQAEALLSLMKALKKKLKPAFDGYKQSGERCIRAQKAGKMGEEARQRAAWNENKAKYGDLRVFQSIYVPFANALKELDEKLTLS